MTQNEETQYLVAKLAPGTCDGVSFRLPVPKPGDDLETTARNLRELADAVTNGRSLTLSTSQAFTSRKQPDAEAFAKERMTTKELTQYEDWKQKKLTPPIFDWAANQEPVSLQAMETFTQRAAAMDIIWQRQGTAPANAAWLTNKMPGMMPLVRAITKILKARAHLEQHNSMAGLTASEIAEVETLRLVNATVEANVARERERLWRLVKSINESQTVLKDRLKGLGR